MSDRWKNEQIVRVRFGKEQRQAIDRMAEALGMSRSALLRTAVMTLIRRATSQPADAAGRGAPIEKQAGSEN